LYMNNVFMTLYMNNVMSYTSKLYMNNVMSYTSNVNKHLISG
jgi:hypothetical protein